jgi:hypothetical protein
MKLLKLLSITSIGVLTSLITSCHNQDVDFPDYEGGTTVYFAYQYPVRTIVLGEDIFDTSLDNQHRCEIYATMGGVYENTKNISIDFAVDNTLCDKLLFEDKSAVKAMPSNYYSLDNNQILLSKKLQGAVGVQLNDAFFADPNALKNTYVIPLVMTDVQNADHILTGRQLVEGAPRTFSDGWDIKPQDYILYCIKFINPWHANYLRRGLDKVTENGLTTSIVRHAQYVEKDQVCKLTTDGLKTTIFPVSTSITTTDNSGNPVTQTITCNLLLTFNDNNECTITSKTTGYTASGTGKFVKNGDKNSWGNKDRNVLYLDYNVDFGTKQYATKDTLVVRDRGVAAEWFKPTYVTN